jgi:hypothetical protein
MIAIARPVIKYFNERKNENDARAELGDETPGRLQLLSETADVTPIKDIKWPRSVFIVPKPAKPKKAKGGPRLQKIRFSREEARAREVKKSLGAKNWVEVGEQVFEYYYSAECADE